jgi:hypothetical protein
MDKEEMDPGNAAIVIAEPVSQIEVDKGSGRDATDQSNRNLRKKRRRKGYYQDLAKGRRPDSI